MALVPGPGMNTLNEAVLSVTRGSLQEVSAACIQDHHLSGTDDERTGMSRACPEYRQPIPRLVAPEIACNSSNFSSMRARLK